MAASHRFAAPCWFRRATVGLAVTLIVLELAVAALSSYVAAAVPTCAPSATRAVLRLFWIALAVQGVAVTTFAAATYATARTVVEHEDGRLALRNPWRSWNGAATDVTRAYVQRAFLTLEVARGWLPWRVRLAATDGAGIAQLRDRLAPGVWLEGASLRRHQLRRLVPALVAVAVLGVLALHLVERTLERIAMQ